MSEQVSFMSFCSNEPYRSMTASQAWDLYQKKVLGKINKELSEFCEVSKPNVILKSEE